MTFDIRSVALAAAEALVLLSLAACGDGDGADPAPAATANPVAPAPAASTPAPGPAPAPAPTPTPTPTPAPAPTPTPAPAPAAVGLSDACKAFYAAAPNFTLTTRRAIDPMPALAKPAKGVAYAEPTYKTCMVRTTDHVADGLPGIAKNAYSRRQAFNADSTRQLVYSVDGGTWHIYDANTHARLKELSGPAADSDIQWHSTRPDLIYFVAGYMGSSMQVTELNVVNGTKRVIGDFGDRLRAMYPGATPTNTLTNDEGSPSKDGRYWCFMVRDADHPYTDGPSKGSWRPVGVFTWDRDTDTILGSMPLTEIPDHVSMSPNGTHCVVSSDGPIGTAAFSRDFKKKTPLLISSQHSDLGIDANGRDVYIAVNYKIDPAAEDGEVFAMDLETGAKTTLFNVYTEAQSNLHLSGKAFNKPGWLLFDANADEGDDTGGPRTRWMQRKVMAMPIKANAPIYSLAFTRVRYIGYDTAPVASVNRDFTRIVFNSNWGGGQDVDVYSIEIPAGLLK